MSYFRDNIDAMEGYTPGEQPAPGEKVVKLNTNENPYPPSPRALAALKAMDPDLLRRYPMPSADPVRRQASAVFSVPEDWVLVGNGSDDLLAILVDACAGPGRTVVCPVPTYVLYETLAQIADARFVTVPFDEDYNLPLDALAEADGALTFIANPNSPSGTCAPLEQLDLLASRLSGVMVIDEAYVDFARVSALELIKTRPNVIVLRTLSKGYSLAGLRLGFAMAQPGLIGPLTKVKDSYNVSSVSAAVGAGALADQAYMRANADKIRASRELLRGQLEQLGFRVWPSQANFLLARPADGQADGLYKQLKARGILVRYFHNGRLSDKLRITVGTDDQNGVLISALKELLRQ